MPKRIVTQSGNWLQRSALLALLAGLAVSGAFVTGASWHSLFIVVPLLSLVFLAESRYEINENLIICSFNGKKTERFATNEITNVNVHQGAFGQRFFTNYFSDGRTLKIYGDDRVAIQEFLSPRPNGPG